MSTDTFEGELRSLLHESADAEGPAYVDVDPHAVVTQGRRVVRRRRMAAGAGIAAASVALGLVGFAALGDGVRRAEPLPGSSTNGSAGSTTGTVSVDLAHSADAAPEGGAPEGRPTVRVTVDRVTGRVDYSVVRDGVSVQAGTDTMPTSPQATTWVSPAGVDGLVVGVVPAAATDLFPVWAGDAPGATHTMEPLGSTSYQAFAIWHTGTPGETSLAGLDWSDGDTVYSSLGLPLPSGRSDGAVAFVDRALGVFGIIRDGSSATKSMVGLPADQVPVLMTGRARSGSALMDNTVLVVLPAGSQGVDAEPSAGATVESVSTSQSSTGDTIVILWVTASRDTAGTGVHRVTWTNADGSAGSLVGSGL
jgi:hypothetical protein